MICLSSWYLLKHFWLDTNYFSTSWDTKSSHPHYNLAYSGVSRDSVYPLLLVKTAVFKFANCCHGLKPTTTTHAEQMKLLAHCWKLNWMTVMAGKDTNVNIMSQWYNKPLTKNEWWKTLTYTVIDFTISNMYNKLTDSKQENII